MVAILQGFRKLTRVIPTPAYLVHEDQRILRRQEPKQGDGFVTRQRAHFIQQERRGRVVVGRFGERRKQSGNSPIITGGIRLCYDIMRATAQASVSSPHSRAATDRCRQLRLR
jgi:hypothetical protein